MGASSGGSSAGPRGPVRPGAAPRRAGARRAPRRPGAPRAGPCWPHPAAPRAGPRWPPAAPRAGPRRPHRSAASGAVSAIGSAASGAVLTTGGWCGRRRGRRRDRLRPHPLADAKPAPGAAGPRPRAEGAGRARLGARPRPAGAAPPQDPPVSRPALSRRPRGGAGDGDGSGGGAVVLMSATGMMSVLFTDGMETLMGPTSGSRGVRPWGSPAGGGNCPRETRVVSPEGCRWAPASTSTRATAVSSCDARRSTATVVEMAVILRRDGRIAAGARARRSSA